MATTFSYPSAERDDSIVDKLFDREVPDPYRLFEDPHDQRTKEFVSKQNEVTEPFLNQCPHRSKIREMLKTSQDYKKIGCPFKRGNKYYLFINEGLQPQSVLYQQDTIDSEPKVFFDPNKLSDDGTVALNQFSFSDDGQYFAYGLSYSGSDWIEIGVKNVLTGEELPDKLKRAKFTSIAWTHDNKGFFYAQYPSHQGLIEGTETEKNENHSVYYHVLNTPQSEDILKVDFPDHPKWNISFEVSHDGKTLHVFPREGCNDNLWLYCQLDQFGLREKLSLKPIYDKTGAQFEYISNNGNEVYFKTNLEAENYRVAKLDINNPGKENWVDVIPNHPKDLLDWAEYYTVDGKDDYLLVNYLRKVVYYLELRKLDGSFVKQFNTSKGTIAKHSGRRDDDEFFFLFTSFLTPGQTYHFDLKNLDGEARLLRQSKPSKFDPEQYTIEQVFFRSKDDTEVPMFIIHRKDLVKDGKNPCILYGYGGFNIQITSTFNINRIVWLKNFKGIFAVANIRGGGEMGQNWHDSGRLLNKQNSFDDFVAAGEYLIDNKYTNRDRLAIEGGSNGGLLVAATSNQRPDKFGACICHVGVLDMIRFTSFTIGHAWTSDYGDPKEREHFENLIKFSPYHNIPEDTDHYPATLLLTADHDDRVVPAHSLKFIAQLQHKIGKKLPETPLLIRVDTKAGHGSGRPVSKRSCGMPGLALALNVCFYCPVEHAEHLERAQYHHEFLGEDSSMDTRAHRSSVTEEATGLPSPALTSRALMKLANNGSNMLSSKEFKDELIMKQARLSPNPDSQLSIDEKVRARKEKGSGRHPGPSCETSPTPRLPDKLTNTSVLQREKRPFAYSPDVNDPNNRGKLDLSQIKSPMMRRRLIANMEESQDETDGGCKLNCNQGENVGGYQELGPIDDVSQLEIDLQTRASDVTNQRLLKLPDQRSDLVIINSGRPPQVVARSLSPSTVIPTIVHYNEPPTFENTQRESYARHQPISITPVSKSSNRTGERFSELSSELEQSLESLTLMANGLCGGACRSSNHSPANYRPGGSQYFDTQSQDIAHNKSVKQSRPTFTNVSTFLPQSSEISGRQHDAGHSNQETTLRGTSKPSFYSVLPSGRSVVDYSLSPDSRYFGANPNTGPYPMSLYYGSLFDLDESPTYVYGRTKMLPSHKTFLTNEMTSHQGRGDPNVMQIHDQKTG